MRACMASAPVQIDAVQNDRSQLVDFLSLGDRKRVNQRARTMHQRA
jgi:hypothetical protein